MSNLVSFAAKIEVGAKFIIPVYVNRPAPHLGPGVTKPYIVNQYEVEITRVDESVYMTCLTTGKTGIESLTGFKANVDAGNYIEVL